MDHACSSGTLLILFMDQQHSIRAFIFLILAGLVFSLGYRYVIQQSTDTVIVFCDVGQGDGAYIRMKNDIDIIIDAGPGSRMSYCISKYMPMYDKTIEYAFITHPQKDHYGGLIPILQKYEVQTIYSTGIGSAGKTYDQLERLAQKQGTIISQFDAGTKIQIGDAMLSQVWPNRQFLNAISHEARNEDFITTRYSKDDPNQTSQILLFRQGRTSVLFTGDVSLDSIRLMLRSAGCDRRNSKSARCGFSQGVTLLKVPHHGSKNNLSAELLDVIRPKYAVISAGKNNSFGHPHKEVVRLLDSKNITTYVTAEKGSIIFRQKNDQWKVSFE